jgi:hypothetical protein
MITVCGRKCLNFEHFRPQTVIMVAMIADLGWLGLAEE